MAGLIETLEHDAAAAYGAVKNAVLGIATTVENKTAEVKKIRSQFASIYATLKATDSILNTTAAKITNLQAHAASSRLSAFYDIQTNQSRLAKNQTALNQYINAAIDKYHEILIGDENENISDLGLLPVLVGAISIAAIAAVAALIAYIAKLVTEHKNDVLKQQSQVNQYEKLLSSLENGKIDTGQFSSLWQSTTQTAALSSKEIMPLLIVGGIIIAGLLFLNRTL